MAGAEFWSLACLSAVLVGLSKGGLPVVGMLAVPVLALALPPVAAAGLLLPVFVASDLVGLCAYRRAWNRRVLAILAPAAVLGIGLGWMTAAQVPQRLVAGIVGAIGVGFALILLTGRLPEPAPAAAAAGAGRAGGSERAQGVARARIGPGLFWGALAGYTSFVSHAGAPPYQIYVLPLGLGKTAFAATTTVFFAFVNAVKLVPYGALGQLSAPNLAVAAILVLPAGLAVVAGVRLVRILPERIFFRLVSWALLAVSLKHLWDGIAGG